MKISTSMVQEVRIEEVEGLDPIDVILKDIAPGKGNIVIRCYDEAFAGYWGAMGESRDIGTFFCECDEHYIAGNLKSGLHEKVNDYEKLPDHAAQFIRKRREEYDITEGREEELLALAEDVLDCDDQPNHRVMGDIFGEQWWSEIPQKPNPDYVYLCKIILAVQAALRQIKANGEVAS